MNIEETEKRKLLEKHNENMVRLDCLLGIANRNNHMYTIKVDKVPIIKKIWWKIQEISEFMFQVFLLWLALVLLFHPDKIYKIIMYLLT
jgi:hypothetical protein